MGDVILFPRHKLARCGPRCEGCFICNGGLASCETCGGAEASLPTHCPQRRMDALECSMVQSGRMNFKRGKWVFHVPKNGEEAWWNV